MSQKLRLHFGPVQPRVSYRNQRSKRNPRNTIHSCKSCYPIFFDEGHHQVLVLTFFLLSLKIKVKLQRITWSLNPPHPNISMHILHTVLYTVPKVLTGRICLRIKIFFNRWSFPLFSWPYCLIQGSLLEVKWLKFWCRVNVPFAINQS